MEENSLFAFIALIIPVLLGRYLVHQSLTKMPSEKKQAIDESVQGMQKLRFFAIFVIVGTIYFLPKPLILFSPYLLLLWVGFIGLKYPKQIHPRIIPLHFLVVLF